VLKLRMCGALPHSSIRVHDVARIAVALSVRRDAGRRRLFVTLKLFTAHFYESLSSNFGFNLDLTHLMMTLPQVSNVLLRRSR
jgi:hypothetical protein